MMDYAKILEYGKKYYDSEFIRTEESGDYALLREDNTLYVFLEWSNGATDWKNNFDFPAKPYKDMGATWYCHRGFLRVWKAIEPHVRYAIMDQTVTKIVVIGYSHGAAVATLAHEYVWYNRPDLRDTLEGYGFGCPRCYWGFKIKKSLRERWANFYPIRNENDIVTHVPPALFGFRHVKDIIQINSGADNSVLAHYWEEYEKGLQNKMIDNE